MSTTCTFEGTATLAKNRSALTRCELPDGHEGPHLAHVEVDERPDELGPLPRALDGIVHRVVAELKGALK